MWPQAVVSLPTKCNAGTVRQVGQPAICRFLHACCLMRAASATSTCTMCASPSTQRGSPASLMCVRPTYSAKEQALVDLWPVQAMEQCVRVVQNAGEIIFVPSGWYHQVHNLVRTGRWCLRWFLLLPCPSQDNVISINHNWANAFNADGMLEHIESELKRVWVLLSSAADAQWFSGTHLVEYQFPVI